MGLCKVYHSIFALPHWRRLCMPVCAFTSDRYRKEASISICAPSNCARQEILCCSPIDIRMTCPHGTWNNWVVRNSGIASTLLVWPSSFTAFVVLQTDRPALSHSQENRRYRILYSACQGRASSLTRCARILFSGPGRLAPKPASNIYVTL